MLMIIMFKLGALPEAVIRSTPSAIGQTTVPLSLTDLAILSFLKVPKTSSNFPERHQGQELPKFLVVDSYDPLLQPSHDRLGDV